MGDVAVGYSECQGEVFVDGTRYTYQFEKCEDGWYVAFVDGLPGCGTQARTRTRLGAMVVDAIKIYLAAW